ncbi:MAG: efflux RND transporter periplasmic adaptor subunit, partial [Myxococcota bacterium]
AQIDPTQFEAQLAQARANVFAAKADVEKAEASVTETSRALERVRTLYSKKFSAAGDLDAADAAALTAKAALGAAKARVDQMEAAARIAATNLMYTRIISPVAGTVISRSVNEGQTVAASFQTPTLFTIAQDLTKMQIDTNVAEADIGKIREGQEAEFTVDAYPEEVFKGVVTQVRNAAVTIQNVVTYDVVVGVDNKDHRLKPGMTTNVSFIVEKRTGVLKASNAALRFTPQGAGKQREPSVWRAEQGKPVRVSVKRGISDGTYTEVTAPELAEGMELIVETLDKTVKPSMPGMPGAHPPGAGGRR